MLTGPSSIATARPTEPQDPAARQAAELRLIKSRFLASLNHQIRTPMSGILGMIDLLMETPLDTDQKEYVVATRICAQELFDLLSASLDFSALMADAVPLEESEFDLADTLESSLSEYALQAESKGLDLFANVGGDLPQIVIGYAGRLRQMVAQLLSNAVKFTSEGYIELSASAAPLDEGRCLLRVEIRDTGVGIEAGQLASLFERKDAGDNWYGASGLGLGVALCLRLAHLMGGSLEAESKPGEGSVFRLQLPVRLAAAPATADWNPALRGKHVIVLNPRPGVARSMAVMLERFGLRVTAAATLEEAGKVLQAETRAGAPPWAVIFDAERLGEDCGAIITTLRSCGAHAFLLSTVWASHTHRLAPVEVADGEITKPVRRYALYDMLIGLLSRAAKPERGPRSILVAEDNLVSQRLVAHVLRRGGYLVETASSGDASIRSVQTSGGRPFDLILMDLQMPGIDGLEATEAIRRLPEGKNVPIVALTADTSEEMRARCREHGMNGYLVKPIRSEDLLSAVSRCLD